MEANSKNEAIGESSTKFVFKCETCHKEFFQRQNLFRHKMMVHKIKDGKFKCQLCTYHSESKAKLKRHMDIHREDRPIACPLCSYTTVSQERLKSHLSRAHDDKDPVECDLCHQQIQHL